MMHFVTVFLVLVGLLAKEINCNETEVYGIEHDLLLDVPIYEIKYKIHPEKVSKILADLVIKNDYVGNMEFRNVLQELNVNVNNDFVSDVLERPGYEYLINKSNTKLIDIVRNVVDRIPNKRENLKAIAALLDIDYQTYMDAMTYTEEESLRKLINNANFNETTLIQVYQLANMSFDDVRQIVEDNVISKISNRTFKECIEIFGSVPIRRLLNETLNKIKVKSLKPDSLINSVLTEYIEKYNLNPVWSVSTNQGIISIPLVYENWMDCEPYIQMYLQDIQNETKQYMINNVSQLATTFYYRIHTNETDIDFNSSIALADNYSVVPKNCYFVQKWNNTLEQIYPNVYCKENQYLYAQHSSKNVNLGTPFICNGQLYGLLSVEHAQRLDLLTTGVDDNYSDDCDIDEGDTDESGTDETASKISLYCLFGVLLVVIL